MTELCVESTRLTILNVPLEISVVPYFRDNPYQRLFIETLLEDEYRVSTHDTLREVCAQIRGERIHPQIIHLHWLYTGQDKEGIVAYRRLGGLFWRLLWLRRRGIRVVWTVHNLFPHECLRPRLEALKRYCVAHLVDRLLVHSQEARELITGRWRLSSSKVSIVPHPHYIGVYPDTVSRKEAEACLKLESDRVRLLFLGAIRGYKQVPLLINAFQRIHEPNLELLIAGKIHPADSDLATEIRVMADKCPCVVLREGFVENDDIQKYMQASDAVVFPYRDTLCSGAAILAMSYGKACVVPRAISFSSILDEKGAVFYEASSEESLAEAMHRAHSSVESLTEMGSWNLEKIRQQSPERCTTELIEQYSTL